MSYLTVQICSRQSRHSLLAGAFKGPLRLWLLFCCCCCCSTLIAQMHCGRPGQLDRLLFHASWANGRHSLRPSLDSTRRYSALDSGSTQVVVECCCNTMSLGALDTCALLKRPFCRLPPPSPYPSQHRAYLLCCLIIPFSILLLYFAFYLYSALCFMLGLNLANRSAQTTYALIELQVVVVAVAVVFVVAVAVALLAVAAASHICVDKMAALAYFCVASQIFICRVKFLVYF